MQNVTKAANMKQFTKSQLDEILADHSKWCNDPATGKKADLAGADLSFAYLPGADLSGANLSGANLANAHLSKANLSGADLTCASLSSTDLFNADLSKADLSGAILFGAYLSGADMRGANLTRAHLSGASGLDTVKYSPLTTGLRLIPPETGEYVAWKLADGNIVKLLIPASAKRSSATTRKCRASEAKVLGIYTMKGKQSKITTVYSDYDKTFAYKVGKTVAVSNFDTDRWLECAPGIHHFLTMQEAINYHA